MNKKYDMVFGNWALCYLNDIDIKPVLEVVSKILKKDGILILKESILDEDEWKQRKCPYGSEMIYR